MIEACEKCFAAPCACVASFAKIAEEEMEAAQAKAIEDHNFVYRDYRLTKWDVRFMELARLVSTWSKDEPGVGAVIASQGNVVNGLGFNGFPRNIDDDDRLKDDKVKNQLMVHAEANALMQSKSNSGCILYTTRFPCTGCAKMIIQYNIVVVVTAPPKTEGKWAEDAAISKAMLDEAGVEVILYE